MKSLTLKSINNIIETRFTQEEKLLLTKNLIRKHGKKLYTIELTRYMETNVPKTVTPSFTNDTGAICLTKKQANFLYGQYKGPNIFHEHRAKTDQYINKLRISPKYRYIVESFEDFIDQFLHDPIFYKKHICNGLEIYPLFDNITPHENYKKLKSKMLEYFNLNVRSSLRLILSWNSYVSLWNQNKKIRSSDLRIHIFKLPSCNEINFEEFVKKN